MHTEFLSNLIKTYQREDVHIYVTDTTSRIIACTESSRIGTFGNTARYIISTRHPASIQDTCSIHDGPSHYGVPISVYGNIKYVVVTYGNPEYTIALCHTLQAALQTALEYEVYRYQKATKRINELDEIASLMLSCEPANQERLITLMNRNNLDSDIPRFVIDISLNLEKMYDIMPTLAYDSAIETLKKTIITKLKTHKSLNSQDLFYSPDQNNILIIKTITKSKHLSETYDAMNQLCKDFVEILHTIEQLSFYISYGNFSNKIDNIHASWMEATELILIGRIHADKELCDLKSLLLGYLTITQSPHISNQFFTTAQEKLIQEDGKMLTHLLDTAEAFVDHQFNLSATAQALHFHRNTVAAYLKQFTELTGYDPASNFQDALLTKLMAIHLRYSNHYKTMQKTI